MYQPYVYRITNTITGEFYHGSRTAKIMNTRSPEEDLWIYYFTHSKDIKTQRSKYDDEVFRAEVIQVCQDSDTAFWAEQNIIKKSIKSDFCLNKQYVEKTSNSKKYLGSGPKTQEQKDHLAKINKGRKHTKETKDKMSIIQQTRKPHAWSEARQAVIDKMVAINTGKPCSDDKKQKLSKAGTGKKRSPESCARIKAARAKQVCNKRTDATKEKMALARRIWWENHKKETK